MPPQTPTPLPKRKTWGKRRCESPSGDGRSPVLSVCFICSPGLLLLPAARSASGGFSVETPAPRAGLAQTRLSESRSEHVVTATRQGHVRWPPGKGPRLLTALKGCPWWLSGKEPACNAGDPGLIPGLGTSPGEGHGNPLRYSCLGNPMQSMGSQRVGHD